MAEERLGALEEKSKEQARKNKGQRENGSQWLTAKAEQGREGFLSKLGRKDRKATIKEGHNG